MQFPNLQICGISVWYDEKQHWITKWDGADDSQMEAVKGGLSDSMNRAACQGALVAISTIWKRSGYLLSNPANHTCWWKNHHYHSGHCRKTINDSQNPT